MSKFLTMFVFVVMLFLFQSWSNCDAAETKPVSADDSGTAFYDATGKQCGWLDYTTTKYYPLLPNGNFGDHCPIPKGATVAKPMPSAQCSTSISDSGCSGAASTAVSSGCGASSSSSGASCGSASSSSGGRRGIFGGIFGGGRLGSRRAGSGGGCG